MKHCTIIYLCITILIISFMGCGLPGGKQENPQSEDENLIILVDFLDTDLNRSQESDGMPTRGNPEDVAKVVITRGSSKSTY